MTPTISLFSLLPHKQQPQLHLLPEFKTHLHMQTSSQSPFTCPWQTLNHPTQRVQSAHLELKGEEGVVGGVNKLKSTCSFYGYDTGVKHKWQFRVTVEKLTVWSGRGACGPIGEWEGLMCMCWLKLPKVKGLLSDIMTELYQWMTFVMKS